MPHFRSLLLGAVLLLPLSCATGGDGACGLAKIAATLAGEGATNCGVVPIDGDAGAMNACLVAAFEAGEASYGIHELQGMDSQVAQAVVTLGSSALFLAYDSDPSGGSDVGAVVTEYVCDSPSVGTDDGGHEALECAEAACSCEVEDCGEAGACCGS